MILPDNREIPCFLCGEILRVKLSKSEKPYFICQQCGLQAFVRYTPGIKRLTRLLETLGEGFLDHQKNALQVLSVVSRLNQLEQRSEQLQDSRSLGDLVFGNEDKEHARRLLEKEVRMAKKQLRELRS